MSKISLQEINAQIQQLETQRAQLQSEAYKQRKEAMTSVVQELIEKIATYGITAKDLGFRPVKADTAKQARKSAGAKIKRSGKTYTGPEGQTWTEGTRGRKPAWLKEQLSETA